MGIVRIPMRLSNRWIIGGLASIFGLVVGVPPAAGTVVTIAFSGELTFVEDGFDLSDPIEVGTAFSGRYSFDPDGVTDTQPDDPRIGSYPFPTGFMSVRVGDNVFESLGIHLAIWNNLPAGSSDLDIYQAGIIQASVPPSRRATTGRFVLLMVNFLFPR
jgi:hypothetical protein